MPNRYIAQEQFAEADTLPADTDGPHIKAADVNCPFAASADRAEFLRRSTQRDFMYSGDTGLLVPKSATWNEREQAWYAASSDSINDVAISWNHGADWEVLGLVSYPPLIALAANPSGDVVLLSHSTSTHKRTFASYGVVSFVEGMNALIATPSGGDICFAPDASGTTGRFVVVYRNGTDGMIVESSATGTGAEVDAWTSGNANPVPTSWKTYAGTNDPVVASTAGITVAAFIDADAAVLRSARSRDGGLTWSEDATYAFVDFAPTIISRPAFDAFTGEWFILLASAGVFEIASLDRGDRRWRRVYRSVDPAGAETAHDLVCSRRKLFVVLSNGRLLEARRDTIIDRLWTFEPGLRIDGDASARFRLFTGAEILDGECIRKGGQLLLLNPTTAKSRSTTFLGDGSLP